MKILRITAAAALVIALIGFPTSVGSSGGAAVHRIGGVTVVWNDPLIASGVVLFNIPAGTTVYDLWYEISDSVTFSDDATSIRVQPIVAGLYTQEAPWTDDVSANAGAPDAQFLRAPTFAQIGGTYAPPWRFKNAGTIAVRIETDGSSDALMSAGKFKFFALTD